jgi:DNA-binding NarL/FixJ family response regulator
MMSVQHKDDIESAQTGRKVWRTLLVDDHELFRDGLRELLENEPDIEICGEAESEEDAYQQFQAVGADLVIVDINLASGQGLELASRIKALRPVAIVLVLSMYDDRVYAERALAAGASGYVCKQSTNNEIMDAVRTVKNGQIYVRDEILQRILSQKVGKKPAPLGRESDQLSDRELQVFTMIGKGRTTHSIAAELHLAVSTVETYRERLKTKLNLESGAELTRRAILWVIQNS